MVISFEGLGVSQGQVRRMQQLADSVVATAQRAGDKILRLRAMLGPRAASGEAGRIATEVDTLARDHTLLAAEEESFSRDIRWEAWQAP